VSLSSCRFLELRNKRSLILIVQETAKGEGGSSGCKMIQLASANPLLTPHSPGLTPLPALIHAPALYHNITLQTQTHTHIERNVKRAF